MTPVNLSALSCLFSDQELDNEIALTQLSIDSKVDELHRLNCIMQLLINEKEKRENEKI